MPFDSKGGGRGAAAAPAPAVTLAAFADALTVRPTTGADVPVLFRWAQHEARSACTRCTRLTRLTRIFARAARISAPLPGPRRAERRAGAAEPLPGGRGEPRAGVGHAAVGQDGRRRRVQRPQLPRNRRGALFQRSAVRASRVACVRACALWSLTCAHTRRLSDAAVPLSPAEESLRSLLLAHRLLLPAPDGRCVRWRTP